MSAPYRNEDSCPQCEARTMTWERIVVRVSENAGPILALAVTVVLTVVWGVLLFGHETSVAGPAHVWLAGACAGALTLVTFFDIVTREDDDSRELTAGLILGSLYSLTLVAISAIVCAVFQ
jgi:hypothetical protein